MKRIIWLMLLVMLLLSPTALADDVCTVADIRAASVITTADNYLTLSIPAAPGQDVTVSVYDDSGLVWQQCREGVAGPYMTDEIYLKVKGGDTAYHVAVNLGGEEIAFDVIRQIGRLKGNAACTDGYPISGMSGADTWQRAAIIPAADGVTYVPVVTANGREIGQACLQVSGGQLTVFISVYDGETAIDSGEVLAARSRGEAAALGRKQFSGIRAGLGQPVDLSGCGTAAVWVKLKVSYNPANAAQYTPNDGYWQKQWQGMD
ncbi:MAG: hypothetical protein Q4C54_02745 [Clostridia bacterium]|nr:hypothetical protein [Clostridia bacterium]